MKIKNKITKMKRKMKQLIQEVLRFPVHGLDDYGLS